MKAVKRERGTEGESKRERLVGVECHDVGVRVGRIRRGGRRGRMEAELVWGSK